MTDSVVLTDEGYELNGELVDADDPTLLEILENEEIIVMVPEDLVEGSSELTYAEEVLKLSAECTFRRAQLAHLQRRAMELGFISQVEIILSKAYASLEGWKNTGDIANLNTHLTNITDPSTRIALDTTYGPTTVQNIMISTLSATME